MTEALLKELRAEGLLKPLKVHSGSEPIRLKLTPNATYLVTVTE